MFAGPSKGPDRKRNSTKSERSDSCRHPIAPTGVTQNRLILELSNSASPPAEPGVYLDAINL